MNRLSLHLKSGCGKGIRAPLFHEGRVLINESFN